MFGTILKDSTLFIAINIVLGVIIFTLFCIYIKNTENKIIGTIGLIKAINTFNPDKNINLATYASRCIENEILMYFR